MKCPGGPHLGFKYQEWWWSLEVSSLTPLAPSVPVIKPRGNLERLEQAEVLPTYCM